MTTCYNRHVVILLKIKKLAGSKYFPLLSLVFLAFIIKLAFLLEINQYPFLDELSLDPGFFDRWGMRIAGGKLLGKRAFFAAPLYPYLLGAVYAVFGHSLFIVRFFQIVLSSINVILIFYLGKGFFNQRTACLASLFYIFCGVFYFYESLILKTSLGVFFNLVFLVSLASFQEKPSGGKIFFAGFTLGLAAAIRGNVLLLLPFLYFYLCCLGDRKKRLRNCLIFSAGFALVLSPITLHNFVVSEDLVLVNSNAGVNFYIGNNPRADGTFKSPPGIRANMEYEEADYLKLTSEWLGREPKPSEVSRIWFQRGLDFLVKNPGQAVKLYLRKVLLFWNRMELSDNQDYYFYRSLSKILKIMPSGFGLVAPLGLAGMLIHLKRWRSLFLLYLFVVVYFLSTILFFIFARYRLGMLPFLIIFAAAFSDILWQNFCENRLKQLLPKAGALAMAAMLVFWPIPGMKSTHTLALSYNKYGHSFYKAKKYQQAINYYNKALEYFPGYVDVYNRLGIVYL